eukprot:TRINITY_DN74211_c0_g1_i1.p1 TRINITY_DN74211_c0_g1~~TRINITY_DN74211_c0_g1_i1.p1  ORF type:complete len:546 (+),score=83.19 TRINITY_DN74211_c0_g1_i1:95-1732(+)
MARAMVYQGDQATYGYAARDRTPQNGVVRQVGRGMTPSSYPSASTTASRSSAAGRGTGSSSSSARQPRCFTSRHVPDVAESLVSGNTPMAPSATQKLQGLLRHLKQTSTETDERRKRAMAANCEAFVPEEFEEVLHSEFRRRCAFGDRSNTELMTSAKWVKLLQDCEVVVSPSTGSSRGSQSASSSRTSPTSVRSSGAASGMASLATADVVFLKVIGTAKSPSGKRLTYELFCKALMLFAQSLYPDLDNKTAFLALLRKVAALAPPPDVKAPGEDTVNLTLEPSVILVLDRFKPKLRELFRAFCSRHLPGSRRLRRSSTTGGVRTTMAGDTLTSFRLDTTMSGRGGATLDLSMSSMASGSSLGSDARSNTDCSDAGSFRVAGESDEGDHTDTRPRRRSLQEAAWSCSSGVQDTIADSVSHRHQRRSHHMSLEQMLAMCKEMEIMPEHLSRLEVISIFKRAQNSASRSQGKGSSLHGVLSYEEFIDAIGQIAIEAFSKPPYGEEHQELHDKVNEFLTFVLPKDERALRERFFYGCNRMSTITSYTR